MRIVLFMLGLFAAGVPTLSPAQTLEIQRRGSRLSACTNDEASCAHPAVTRRSVLASALQDQRGDRVVGFTPVPLDLRREVGSESFLDRREQRIADVRIHLGRHAVVVVGLLQLRELAREPFFVVDVIDDGAELLRKHLPLRAWRRAEKELLHLGMALEENLIEARGKRVVACKQRLEALLEDFEVDGHVPSSSAPAESPCFLRSRRTT